MKGVILYRPNSEHATGVENYAREFEQRTGKKFEFLSIDTLEGAEKAKVYDIVFYPAVLALTDDGRLQQIWAGEQLHLMDEVAAYLRS